MAIENVANIPREALDARLAEVRAAPADSGNLELIVARPQIGERQIADTGVLDLQVGLVGDMWERKPSSSTGAPKPDSQVTVMSSRAVRLVADSDEHAAWAPAGDQLYVDLDLSEENLPAGTRLAIGEEAVLEVTAEPHLGCGKFVKRYGVDAMKFVNSAVGRELRLRGVNTRVVEPGTVRRGDPVRKTAH